MAWAALLTGSVRISASEALKRLSGFFHVVKGMLCPAQDLVGLMPLPRDQDHIARLGLRDRLADRHPAVGLYQGRPLAFKSRHDLLKDLLRLLRPRIVAGHVDRIRPLLRH